MGLLAVVPFALIEAKAPSRDEAKRVFSLSAIKQKGPLFFKLTLPYFLLGAGAGLIIPFLNLYFRNRFDLSPTHIGFYFSILQFTMLAAVLVVPILKRRFGFIRTVVYSELASVPFMLILCYTQDLTMAFWAFLFRGALMNMGQPVGTTFMMEAVQPEDHGLINSLSSVAWTASWAVSAQVGGAIIEHSGFVAVFLVAIALYLASSLAYYYFFSGTEVSETAQVRIDVSRVR
jgi:predicted MFS family arabinose efflux permease